MRGGAAFNSSILQWKTSCARMRIHMSCSEESELYPLWTYALAQFHEQKIPNTSNNRFSSEYNAGTQVGTVSNWWQHHQQHTSVFCGHSMGARILDEKRRNGVYVAGSFMLRQEEEHRMEHRFWGGTTLSSLR